MTIVAVIPFCLSEDRDPPPGKNTALRICGGENSGTFLSACVIDGFYHVYLQAFLNDILLP
jgi:hypothetical protein